MIVAGVGCRRETSADEIERVVRMALGMFGLPVERLDAVAMSDHRVKAIHLSRNFGQTAALMAGTPPRRSKSEVGGRAAAIAVDMSGLQPCGA